MQFLADECIWRDVVDALQADGHRVDWIHDTAPGIDDREVLALAASQRVLLVTEDGDFGDLVFRERLAAYGIVRVRLSQFEGEKKRIAEQVSARLTQLADRLIGQFTILEPDRIRQRVLPVRLAVED